LVGHILRGNCVLKHVIEGKIDGMTEVTGRRGRRRKQLSKRLNWLVTYCVGTAF